MKSGIALLKKVAKAIKTSCRGNDIVARLGGDEFVIALPNTSAVDAEQLIQSIKDKLAKEKIKGIEISISFGYETKTEQRQDIQAVFKRTEDQMYRHKIYESSSMRSKTIDVITSTLFAKNGREHIHSKRVSDYCELLSAKMGFDKDKVNQIRLTGLMHDIGKIGIEDKVLNKSGKLTDGEFNEMKKHSEIGYRILSSVNEFSEISEFVLEHHEKWDGTGYPQGLKGEEIKVEARIIALADSFDAMTTQRAYHDAFSKKDAVQEIERCSGTQFDPAIARLFIEEVLNVS